MYVAGWVYDPMVPGAVALNGQPAIDLVAGLVGDVRLDIRATSPPGLPPSKVAGPALPSSNATPQTSPDRVHREVTFGRVGGGADVQIHDLKAEPIHAAAELQDDGSWAVRRMAGRVLVGGQPRLLEILSPGQTFVIGSTVLQVPGTNSPAVDDWLPSARQPTVSKLLLRGVTVVRGTADKRETVLHSLDCHIPRAQLTAIVGPSGSGKSTLLEVVRGDLPLAAGSIEVDGYRSSPQAWCLTATA